MKMTRSARVELIIARTEHRAAEVFADRRASDRQEYLRGDEATKRRIINKWLDEDLAMAPAHSRVTGLGSQVI